MIDAPFIQKKMGILDGYVGKLEQLIDSLSAAQIRSEEMRMDAVERNFQLAVDQMVDINTHLIKSGNFGTVDDFQSTFSMLGEFGVLERSFAQRMAPIVAVRNMLVHRYEKLDKDLFLTNLQKNFSDFKNYMIQIDAHIRKAREDKKAI